MSLETINIPGIQPRITAGVQTGTGPDMTSMFHNWPHLYQRAIVDVSDVCEEGYYPLAESSARVDGH